MLRGRLVGARWFAEAAAAPTSGGLKLNFFIPGHLFYSKAAVERVTVPGLEGDFGVLESHVPSVAELRPGVVTIDKAGGVSERYFLVFLYVLTLDLDTLFPVDSLWFTRTTLWT